MSQKQIHSLEVLSLSSEDLIDDINKNINENPALVFASDEKDFSKDLIHKKSPDGETHIASRTSHAMEEASNSFQQALEAHVDDRETLQHHLMHQLNMMNLPEPMHEVCEKLIYNLSEKGFHVLSPVSLLNSDDKRQTQELLDKCLETVRQMDPVGCCTFNYEESLFVQAKYSGNAPELALFLLDGHFALLDPPIPVKVAKKINSYIEEQKKLFARTTSEYLDIKADEKSVEEALTFIRTLTPNPGQDFGSEQTHYIAPDVRIELLSEDPEENKNQDGLITTPAGTFKIIIINNLIPKLELNNDMQKFSEDVSTSQEDKSMIKENLQKAKDYMDSLQFRQSTILKSVCAIVKKQYMFFLKGPGNLVPMKQADLAEELGVHESTISRMANNKYLSCSWGLFKLQYFFTKAASSSENSADVSKDKVIFEIKKILEEHSSDAKKLSDQKVSDLLAEKGISIARRTVAKYRNQLNIESSYNRV